MQQQLKKKKSIHFRSIATWRRLIIPGMKYMNQRQEREKNNTQITTLRKPDGSLTAGVSESLKHLLEYFTPEDKEDDDTDNHKIARIQSQEPFDKTEVKASFQRKLGMQQKVWGKKRQEKMG